ncbi:MAG: hypothetical protein HOI70_09020, partial [Opitutae bacterium]|nr:hypothetical protein [Opitutae bacterium]
KFKKLHESNPSKELDLKDSFLFVERKSVPYRISKLSLPLGQIKGFISCFKSRFKLETATEWGREFWWSPVGIMMFHRDIWDSTHGYDERLIYWGWMEGDLALRLGQKHKVVEFSKYVGHDFYHLEHYSNLTEYKDRNGIATPRKKNPVITENLNYQTNERDWGLIDSPIGCKSYATSSQKSHSHPSICSTVRMIWGCCLTLYDALCSKLADLQNRYLSPLRVRLGELRKKSNS